MTISTTDSRISYNGNGVTTVFAFPYRFLANADLVVVEVSSTGVETVKTLTTHYTLTGAGDDAGGSVTMLVAPAVGTRLIVYRDTAITQETDYISGDPFPAETHERALDRLTMIAQEVGSDADRSIKVPVGDPSSLSTVLPAAANRKDKFVVFDATTGEVEVSTVTQTQVASAVAAAYAAGSTADAVTYTPEGTGAVALSVQAYLRSMSVSIKAFGATGDGVTDDTDAIQAALTENAGGNVYIPDGTFLCCDLSVPAETFVWGPGILSKNANGDLISSLGVHAVLECRLHGNGATYTGRGVVVDDGGAATITTGWWRRLAFCEIVDMESYCVEFVDDSGGYGSEMIGGTYTRTTAGASLASVKFPSTETNGNRRMIGVFCFGNSIADLAASDNTLIQGCEGSPPLMTANTLKARVIGNRLAGSGGATIDGQLGVYANNAIAHTAWTLSATLTNTVIEGNNWPGGLTLTDSVPVDASNYISMPRQVYTPTWTSGGSPAIGDGALNGSYIYDGDTCRGNIQITIGSTTNVGSGAWSFSLPKQAARNSSGSCYVEDATGPAVYAGVSHIAAGASVVRCAISGSTAAYMGSATPITWATGDKIEIDFDYQVD
jgi:hypothetical protein